MAATQNSFSISLCHYPRLYRLMIVVYLNMIQAHKSNILIGSGRDFAFND